MRCFCSLILVFALVLPALAQAPRQTAEHLLQSPTTASGEERRSSGIVRDFGSFQIETVIRDSGIQLLLETDERDLRIADARGVVMLKTAGDTKRYRFDLLPEGKTTLVAKVNLVRLKGKQVEIEVRVASLPSRLTPTGTLKYRDVITVAPSETQLAAAAVARQGICPVSGKRLGSMGTPVAVSIGKATVYACCSACVKSIERNPAKFATGKPSILVSTATAVDAEAIARQRVCPVMDEPLGGMGQPLKVMIGDKPVYLCCKGCVKKIEAEPLKYLELVYGSVPASPMTEPPEKVTPTFGIPNRTVGFEENEVRPGVFKVSQNDELFISAQKRCPVMDEPLDAMGGPYKVNAAGKAIYICCPGCAERIASQPEKYLRILEQQGVEAPLIR
jgi:YHS domain-containing protein